MNVDAYLSKLSIGREQPTLDYLKRLQRQHLLTIPFENLSIHYGGRIVLDIKRIYSKIIPSRRGGYCYELNGLFFTLLSELGYKCSLREARFYEGEGKFSAAFDHSSICVEIDDTEYMADVGMMRSFMVPKKIEPGLVQLDYGRYFRFYHDQNEGMLLQQSPDAMNFQTLYKISSHEVKLVQFLDRNDQHQDRQDSYFVLNKLISIYTVNGHLNLTNRKLTILESGETREIDILNEDAFLSKLSQYFGIEASDLVEENG